MLRDRLPYFYRPMKQILYLLAAVSCFAFSACSSGDKPESDRIKIKRFDLCLLNSFENDTADTALFTEEYSSILNIYATGIIKCSAPGDSAGKFISDLKSVYTSTGAFRQLYKETVENYPDLRETEKELSCAFVRYKSLFPDKRIPAIYSHVSGFSQSIILSDSLLSISLDNYLGQNYPGYKGLVFDYQLKNRERSRIALDALTACLYKEFPYGRKTRQVIDGIIYEGGIIYAASSVFPEKEISEILNYSPEQAEWCDKNEKKIWSYMVRSGHLYSSDPLIYSKYLNEAPYTSFFGQESPDRIGKWAGYRIIAQYIKRTGDRNALRKILGGEYDASDILLKSEYGNR